MVSAKEYLVSIFPESYPSPQHLPFNSECLKRSFQMAPPAADPGGEGVLVLLRGSEILVPRGENGGALPRGLPEALRGSGRSPIYIGQWQGVPCRALAVSKKAQIPAGLTGENLLATEPALTLEVLSLGGVASHVLHWEKNSRYCSLCGSEMDRVGGEWGKKCRGCGYAHYPHIHPCVIVVIRDEGRVLLARKAGWPEGRYGLVAGFLDFGECLEEAVAREVMEETGVRVKNIEYVGSQSWPFPSQLMAGFVADYDGGEIVVQEDELEDARWFDVNDLPALPPKRSIARYLIDRYAKEA